MIMEGQPLRELAERIRTPLFEPGRALHTLHQGEQTRLKAEAAKLADVFQRSSSNVEGRNGYRSLRNHELRGLDNARLLLANSKVPKFACPICLPRRQKSLGNLRQKRYC